MSSCNLTAAETHHLSCGPPLPQRALGGFYLTLVHAQTFAGCPTLSSPSEVVALFPLSPVARVKLTSEETQTINSLTKLSDKGTITKKTRKI